MTTFWWSLFVGVAFLAGSIPFGYLIGLAKGVDIRTKGSGNIGATNVGRVFGKPLGLICFIFDAAKGAAPVLLAGWLMGTLGSNLSNINQTDAWWWLATAFASVLGHSFSPWIGFKGGKGVATGFGSMAALWPIVSVPLGAAAVVFILTLLITRFASLASILAATTLPAIVLVQMVLDNTYTTGLPFLAITGLLAIFVLIRHRANISRIRSGTEPRIGSTYKEVDG